MLKLSEVLRDKGDGMVTSTKESEKSLGGSSGMAVNSPQLSENL